MTVDVIPQANKVTVIGMLDTMRMRDRDARRGESRKLIETTRRAGRDRGTGGRWERLVFQVRSPYGGLFALPVEIAPNAPLVGCGAKIWKFERPRRSRGMKSFADTS